MRRSGLATTSGSAGTGPGNDTGVWLIITIILFALLCNYSRTICLIDVGTEGTCPALPQHLPDFFVAQLSAFATMPQLDTLPQYRLIVSDLFGCELFLRIPPARTGRSRSAQPHIGARTTKQFHAVQRRAEQRAVAEAAVAGNQQSFGLRPGLVQTGSQAEQQAHGLLAEVVLFALLAETRLLLRRGLRSRLPQARGRDEAHRNGAGIDVVFAMQRQQQTGLQKAQAPL